MSSEEKHEKQLAKRREREKQLDCLKQQREVRLQKRRAADKRQRSLVASETPEQKRAHLA